jgi:uncharacterized protein
VTGSEELQARHAHVLEQLRTHSQVVVALSGGVDSAVLLALAVEALGTSAVVAVTGRSDAVTDDEIADARRVAADLGVRHQIVVTREFDNAEYLQNRKDRCYHCRSELFKTIVAIVRDRAPARVAYGAILDDLGDDRPGMTAAREFGVLAPLLDAQLTKGDVRTLALQAGIHVAEKPANACLASRVPTGVPVTRERLAQIDRAERGIKALGFSLVRVRHHGELARIEVPIGDVSRLGMLELRRAVEDAIGSAGFAGYAIDRDGYRPAGVRRAAAPALYSIEPQPEGGQ